jgi:hypothetical protein
MRFLSAVAMTILLTATAYGQAMPNLNLIPETQTRTPEEKEQDAIKEKAYKESLKKIPDAKTSSDPWGTVRSDAPKAAASTKPKTKTGSSTAGGSLPSNVR